MKLKKNLQNEKKTNKTALTFKNDEMTASKLIKTHSILTF